ncbi:WXG100 family type VII secretion target [Antrihabitans stalactiti]|uniref:ESAT-6-like protein n=1 Tax=Antrihabitans stalactiti TaxID=2584121 RepID=A0A848KBJ5_9NOCA|nr:WXG100 family type VII secretion target [Antrihabitans stalactiti]NMN96235.1 WXG100 family type VII secretion target [Antrihabitans stalactiti]
MTQSGSIKQDFGGVSALSTDLNADAAKLNSTHDDLQSTVKALFTTWDGSTSTSYLAQQNKWNAAHQELIHVLQTIAKVVEDGNVSMKSTEDREALRWVT